MLVLQTCTHYTHDVLVKYTACRSLYMYIQKAYMYLFGMIMDIDGSFTI